MQAWGWAIASVILLVTLVQLLAYYYLVRGGGGRSMLPSSTDGNGNTSPRVVGRQDAFGDADDADRHGLDDTEEVRRCTKCGAPNEAEPIYTFCRNCGSQL